MKEKDAKLGYPLSGMEQYTERQHMTCDETMAYVAEGDEPRSREELYKQCTDQYRIDSAKAGWRPYYKVKPPASYGVTGNKSSGDSND